MKALLKLYEGSMKALLRLYEGSTKELLRLSHLQGTAARLRQQAGALSGTVSRFERPKKTKQK